MPQSNCNIYEGPAANIESGAKPPSEKANDDKVENIENEENQDLIEAVTKPEEPSTRTLGIPLENYLSSIF